MRSNTTNPDSLRPAAEMAVDLFDNWFDPIESEVRARARGFEHDLRRLWKVRVGQILERMCIFDGGVTVGHFHMPPAFQRCKHHEQIGHAISELLGDYRPFDANVQVIWEEYARRPHQCERTGTEYRR